MNLLYHKDKKLVWSLSMNLNKGVTVYVEHVTLRVKLVFPVNVSNICLALLPNYRRTSHKFLAESSGKMCVNDAQRYLRIG